MNTYNTNPWFDDFKEVNNFHQVMFKPGFAVQARELTQLQTIIKGQIEKFGNHVFKHGSIVIPGNSIADLFVPYVKVVSSVNLEQFNGQVIVGATSGIEAKIKLISAKTDTEDAVFYITYISGSPTNGILFLNSENIYLKVSPSVYVTALATNSTGTGSIAHLNNGVYYVNGSFVSVEAQSVLISKYTSFPSCHVLLKINETIVNSESDETLLDPAQGSYNYAAPGADRLKITLELTTLPLGSSLDSNYIEIMRYNVGELEAHAKNAKYSELEKSLARRTYDESGNYVVDGLVPTVREHLKKGSNGGVYAEGDISKLVIDVRPGKAYIDGFEVEKFSNTKITIDKARTANHIKETNMIMRPEYGQYIIVSDIVGPLSIINHDVVDLYNDNNSLNVSATKVGTAKVIGIDYLTSSGANTIYKLWIIDISLNSGVNIESVGGIRLGVSTSACVLAQYFAPITSAGFTVGELMTHSSGRTATVKFWDTSTSTIYAYKHSHTLETPRVGDLILGSVSATSSVIGSKTLLTSIGQSGLVFRLSKPSVYSLKDATTLNYDLSYTIQKEFTIVTDASGNGDGSASSGEVITPIETGTFIAISPSGYVSPNLFALDVSGSVLTLTSGPVSSVVKVYASVLKTNVSPKTKTLSSTSFVVGSPTPTILLNKTDVISITSIVDSVGDITANYSFNSGQTDYEYNLASVALKSGKPVPIGSITVTFSYYEHSISGDFFCIDSYPSGVLESSTLYQSNSTGQLYDLPACLDFRSTAGVDNLMTGANSRKNSLVVSGTNFNTNLQYYVPRIDVLVIDVGGKMNVVSGIPADAPKIPTVPTGVMAINYFYIPEYTKSAINTVNRRLDVERFTMKNIKQIANRVERVENFATLTNSELSVTSKNVIDAATGLNKFKTGYLVENFIEPLTIARTTDGEYAAIFVAGTLQAKMENLSCNLDILPTSTGFVNSNGIYMLPYTEVVFAEQVLSSRVTNLNPFLVIKWDGILGVNPPSDSWSDIRELPTIFEEITEEVIVNVYSYISCPQPPWDPPWDPPWPIPDVDPPPWGGPFLPPVCPPPLPSTTYGGWYGDVLGRPAETAGVEYWNNTSGVVNTATLVSMFLGSAYDNSQSAANSGHYEGTFNPISADTLAVNSVLTSTTTYAYDNNNSVVATTTGINVDGTAFTNTVVR